MVPLDPTRTSLEPAGLSENGGVVVGFAPHDNAPFRWVPGSPSTVYPGLLEFIDISNNGNTVVGMGPDAMGFSRAMSWTLGAGAVSLGTLPGCFLSRANSVSRDGSVIVGTAIQGACSPGGFDSRAWRWTQATGMTELPMVPSSIKVQALAVSADGSAIVGFYGGLFSSRAALWTEVNGNFEIRDLGGSVPGAGPEGVAYDVARGGCTVVGNGGPGGGNAGFLWDPVNGMRDLHDLLVNDLGLAQELTGYQVQTADAISDDGTWIAGVVQNLNLGRQEPFLAQIPNPVCAICGDGQVGGDEECDDGNALTGDGCRPDCTDELCGDGILDPQEQCDDGNLVSGDGCQASCALPVCGDAVLDVGLGEQCDDGNLDGADGCSETCHLEFCGNGTVDPAEECDDANGATGDGCRPDCTQERCGDGTLDPQELCDDENNTPGDGCRADCTIESCGDGTLDPQEQCDDGNTTSGDGCQAGCVPPECSDGVVDAGEQCDDGNSSPGDGCSASCQHEVCGNGVLDPQELCDDGNLAAGDGCRGDCTIESCGDGTLDPQEQCDDGNQVAGDGCSGACVIEEVIGGEGCRPRFWKQHPNAWSGGYAPDTPFANVFDNAFPGQTLVQVLRQKGGGLKALGRQTVAALLNSASPNVSYDLSAQDVVSMFNTTYPGSNSAYKTLKANFRRLSSQGCPMVPPQEDGDDDDEEDD